MIKVQDLFFMVTVMIMHGAARVDLVGAYLCEFAAGGLIMGDWAVAQPPRIDSRWLEFNNIKLSTYFSISVWGNVCQVMEFVDHKCQV